MTQPIANFMLTPEECNAIKDALMKEYPLINDGGMSNTATRLYQALSHERGNLRCRWPAYEASNLLDRLLVACPKFARSCGLHRDYNVERYPSWCELKKPKSLLAACSKVLVGLGYALPR